MQAIRIIEIPKCKMVSSGRGFFGDDHFTAFYNWFSSLPRSMNSKDFLYWDGKGVCWLYLYEEGITPPERFEIVDFVEKMNAEVDSFLSENGFERDTSRFELGNIITPPAVQKILGYCQMDYYTPIQSKSKD